MIVLKYSIWDMGVINILIYMRYLMYERDNFALYPLVSLFTLIWLCDVALENWKTFQVFLFTIFFKTLFNVEGVTLMGLNYRLDSKVRGCQKCFMHVL